MKNRLSLIILTILLFSISACAVNPSKGFVKTHPESDLKFNRVSQISIIADACLFRDNIGDNDYWAVQESRLAAKLMLNASKSYLENKGYHVKYLQTPFVGAFMNMEMLFKVKETDGGNVLEKKPPFYESDILSQNKEFKEALLKVVPKIAATVNDYSVLTDVCCAGADVRDAMNIISKNVGGDATLFLIGHGKIVSAGKQIAQGVATGLVTAVLTLGMVSVAHYETSISVTYAVLVDNNSGEILWSNFVQLKADPTEQGYYDAENAVFDSWPKNTLYHLPSKTTLSKAKGVTPSSN